MTPEEQTHYDLVLERMRYQKLLEAEKTGQEEQVKMGWGIFLIALVLGLLADIVELFTLGTIGWLFGLFIDLVLFLMLGFTAAGRKHFKKWIWGPLAEKIPFFNTIPLMRAGFLIWSFMASRSSKLKVVSNISQGIA